MTQRSYRQMKEVCEEVGLEVLSFETNKHIKARIRAADGREMTYSFGLTPSDRRGLQNTRADLRRFARGEAIRGAARRSNK